MTKKGVVGKKERLPKSPPPRTDKSKVNTMDKKLETRIFNILDEIYEELIIEIDRNHTVGPLFGAEDAEAYHGEYLALRDGAIEDTYKHFNNTLKNGL